mmetsp:Transcript_36584/g.79698  ORF Transcript_36584/g.79698 Transcript_36584/m.79698 type:complete len:208 (-) Transcript_36584:33-656(-)
MDEQDAIGVQVRRFVDLAVVAPVLEVDVLVDLVPGLAAVEGDEELFELVLHGGGREVVRDGVGAGQNPALVLGVEDHVQHLAVELLVAQVEAAVVRELGHEVVGLEDHEVLVRVADPDAVDLHRPALARVLLLALQDCTQVGLGCTLVRSALQLAVLIHYQLHLVLRATLYNFEIFFNIESSLNVHMGSYSVVVVLVFNRILHGLKH